MATSSTLITIKSALVTKFEAAAGLDGVTVSYGPPTASETGIEFVYLAGAVADVTTPVMRAGRKKRDEQYTVQVIVEVIGDDLTQLQADTRCAALFAEVEGILADDPDLATGETIHWAQLVGWVQLGGSTGTGHACRFEADVQVRARLT